MIRLAETAIILVLVTSGIPMWPVAAQERVPQGASANTYPLPSRSSSVILEVPSEPFIVFDPNQPGTPVGEPWTTDGSASLIRDPTSSRLHEGRGPVGRGGLGMGGPGGPMGGGGPPGYDATWYPSQAVSGRSSDLGFFRQGLNLGAPVWRGDSNMVMASIGVRNTLFSTNAVLPNSLRPFPDELWNVTFGLNYMHQFDNGWSGGLMGGFGSASDKPFYSIDEMTANLGAFLRVPAHNDRDSWQFMLMYLYGGPVNFPIPMLSYAWNPSDQLRVNIGLPFSVAWQPNEDWTLNLSYMPLNNVSARVTYRVAPLLHVYGGYEFLNESYFLADRTDIQDRFFAFEQRLVTGLRWEVWKNAAAEVNGGYSLGRKYGEGVSQWGSLTDRVDVDPGPFLGSRFNLKF